MCEALRNSQNPEQLLILRVIFGPFWASTMVTKGADGVKQSCGMASMHMGPTTYGLNIHNRPKIEILTFVADSANSHLTVLHSC